MNRLIPTVVSYYNITIKFSELFGTTHSFINACKGTCGDGKTPEFKD